MTMAGTYDALLVALSILIATFASYTALSLANRIRADIYADPNKLYTNQQFEDNQTMNLNIIGPGGGNFPGLKTFITNRRASLTNSLAPFGCYLGTKENTPQDFITVHPNPAESQVSIVSAENGGAMISIVNLLGEVVFRQFFSDAQYISIDLSGLPPGLYTLNYDDRAFKKIEIIR